MKILHIIHSLGMGGAQRLLSDILPLMNKNCKISILVFQRTGSEFERLIETAGVDLISLESSSIYMPNIIWKIRKNIKLYDIVHVHLFPSLYFVSLASIGLKNQLVYTEHSTSNSRRNKWYFRLIEKFIYKRYQKIISISQQTQEALTKWLQSNDERFVIINNGVDTARFASAKEPIIPKSLIMVSRFAMSKDQETVIRAMRFIAPDAILRFVGDGENREHCEDVVKELGLQNRVYFLGSRSDVAKLISSSYIGIQSSFWEGFGLTAVEIMSCGKPVIGTDVDGLKQVIEGAGEIFKQGDAQELAFLVNRLLTDQDYYDSLSKKSIERASSYDIHVMTNLYLTLYETLMIS